MDKPKRVMPERVNLGNQMLSTIGHCMMVRKRYETREFGRREGRTVMGFYLPTWQRGLVWTQAQKVAFIESAWKGIPLGTYSYNQAAMGSPYDMLLIDGQQRMSAIQSYLDDEFPVFGYRWSEVTEVDRRFWEMSGAFPCYITKTEDEQYLRDYYNLMNFGGTAHKEDERA